MPLCSQTRRSYKHGDSDKSYARCPLSGSTDLRRQFPPTSLASLRYEPDAQFTLFASNEERLIFTVWTTAAMARPRFETELERKEQSRIFPIPPILKAPPTSGQREWNHLAGNTKKMLRTREQPSLSSQHHASSRMQRRGFITNETKSVIQIEITSQWHFLFLTC